MASFLKKLVIGTALGSGALFLVSHTPAYHYMRTACNAKWNCIKDNIPVDMQVAAINDQVNNLENAMRSQVQNVAREEFAVVELKKNIEGSKVALNNSRKSLLALRDTVPAKDTQLTSNGVDRDKVLNELKVRKVQFDALEQTLATQETTLVKREEALTRAKDQLANFRTKKEELKARLGLIHTQHKANVAAEQGTQPGIDTSALTQIEQQVADLEKQIQLDARTNELTNQFLGQPQVTPAEDNSDVLNDIDAKFGKVNSKADGKDL